MEDLKPMSYEQIVATRKSDRAKNYEKLMDLVRGNLANKSDPVIRAENDAIRARLSNKSITATDVHQNATLSNVSVQYANDDYIGEQLMPVVNVDKKTDIFYIYDQRNRLAYPSDELGERGQANEVSESLSTDTYACKGYGFQNFVDGEVLKNQDAPLNQMVDLVEAINEGLAFKREMRIAAIMGSTANYGSNYTSPTTAWSATGGGDPVKDIQDAISATWQGRGPGDLVAFTSYDVYRVLSRHPAITDLYKYSGVKVGLATPDMLAGFFGLSKLLVGKARKDTANEGQTSASYSRIWSDVFGVARVARSPGIRNAAFGYTFRQGLPRTIQWFDPTCGAADGGYYAKSSVVECHEVVAASTAYLLTSVI